MNEPQINVDHFYHRPTYHVGGLLTDNSQIPAISAELRSADIDIAALKILCGEQGARIFDEDGRYHGLRGRVVRTLQRAGRQPAPWRLAGRAPAGPRRLLDTRRAGQRRARWFSTT